MTSLGSGKTMIREPAGVFFSERVAFQLNQYTAPCDDTEGLGHEIFLKLEAKIDELGTSILRMKMAFAPLGKLVKKSPGVVLWD